MKFKNITLSVAFALTMLTSGLVSAQCPDIYYAESSRNPLVMRRGWDTMITCANPGLRLKATTFITPQMFTGYEVSSIPFNPPDSSFSAGTPLPAVNQDDHFDNSAISFPFGFAFFYNPNGLTNSAIPTNAIIYNSAVVSTNGTVNFNTSYANQNSTYGVHGYTPMSATSNKPADLLNSIMGVWEDIDCRYFNNTGVPGAGVYKSIYAIPPAHQGPECRMLCVSYKGAPKFGHSSGSEAQQHYSTYEIVCFEGTNIIQVHVQRRANTCSTDGNSGVIGIVNNDATNSMIYTAPGWNPCTTEITTPQAWQFKPVGTTYRNITWYLGDTVGDEFELHTGMTPAHHDSVYPIFVYNDGFGGDTAIDVHPDTTQIYTMRLRYPGANGTLYDIRYKVTVGVSKQNTMNIKIGDENGANTTYYSDVKKPVVDSVCWGSGISFKLMPTTDSLASPQHNSWSCNLNPAGFTPRLQYSIGRDGSRDSTFISIAPAAIANLFTRFGPGFDYRDSTEVVARFGVTTDFTNGCSNSAEIVLHLFNDLKDTTRAHICDGESYEFYGQTFNEMDCYNVHYVSEAGCDGIHTLCLQVFHPKEGTVDIKDCNAYTWIDGNTYEESTNPPYPAVHDTTTMGCDSVTYLHFVRDNGLQALISVVPEAATLDLLHIELKDVSLSSDDRIWTFPDGTTANTVTVYYEYPTSEDSVVIWLTAIRTYEEFDSRCTDDTCVVIPLLKEAIWFPNAFTPDRDNNDVFVVRGTGITSFEIEFYDRKGNKVYGYEGIDNFWDGKTFDGARCPVGAYVYVAKYSTILNPGNPIVKRGTVTLIR